jgi:hypothetical protein
MKRRNCSYDLAAVHEDGHIVTDDWGETYLCNARCLCIWAVSLATKPGLSEELKTRKLVLKCPPGKIWFSRRLQNWHDGPALTHSGRPSMWVHIPDSTARTTRDG